MLGFIRRRRRRRIRERPFPDEWCRTLRTNVPAYARLTPDQRRHAQGLIKVFLAEKRFEGAGGLEITDEIRVTIAAQACMLLLGLDIDQPYPGLRTVIVYPKAYFATSRNVGPGGIVTESVMARSGESWNNQTGWGYATGGPVVLAWDEVVKGAMDPTSGHNVVLHEFAHQLDGLATGMDGAPPLPSRSRYTTWAKVLTDEFKRLRRDIALRQPTELRAYGATSPPEFFAVATEAYFEKPERLKERHPDLFEELREFFGWTPGDPTPFKEAC